LRVRMQWYMPPRRPYSRRELLADRTVNFLGAGLSWVAAAALCFMSWSLSDPALKQFCFLANGIGLITMLNCSAIYHYCCWNWPLANRLYSLDHIGISCMIMGSYAPLMFQCNAIVTLIFVWVLGGAGLLMEFRKLCCASTREHSDRAGQWTLEDRLNLVRYLLMGWAVLPVMPTAAHILPPLAVGGFIAGGLLFTGGVGFFVNSRCEFHLALWHLCVLCASICFYLINLLCLAGYSTPSGNGH